MKQNTSSFIQNCCCDVTIFFSKRQKLFSDLEDKEEWIKPWCVLDSMIRLTEKSRFTIFHCTLFPCINFVYSILKLRGFISSLHGWIWEGIMTESMSITVAYEYVHHTSYKPEKIFRNKFRRDKEEPRKFSTAKYKKLAYWDFNRKVLYHYIVLCTRDCELYRDCCRVQQEREAILIEWFLRCFWTDLTTKALLTLPRWLAYFILSLTFIARAFILAWLAQF